MDRFWRLKLVDRLSQHTGYPIYTNIHIHTFTHHTVGVIPLKYLRVLSKILLNYFTPFYLAVSLQPLLEIIELSFILVQFAEIIEVLQLWSNIILFHYQCVKSLSTPVGENKAYLWTSRIFQGWPASALLVSYWFHSGIGLFTIKESRGCFCRSPALFIFRSKALSSLVLCFQSSSCLDISHGSSTLNSSNPQSLLSSSPCAMTQKMSKQWR